MAGAGESPRTVVRIALKACNEVLEAEIRVPTAAIRPVDLLPILMSFDGAVVGVFEKDSVRQGKPITCTKGCGACCRQLVPVSEVEAQYLAELVAEMPPERRKRVETRFRHARKELDRQGITKRLLRSAELASPEERRQLALDYFACGVACPFLEEESCSIHLDRPLICREHNVTSPPERCADPSQQDICGIEIRTPFSQLIRRFADGVGNRPNVCMPLVWALNWASQQSAPMPRLPGPQMLANFFQLVRQAGAADHAQGDS